MTLDRNHAAAPGDEPVALALALEKSQEVTEKVEACADDLGLANDAVKKKINKGATMLPAHEALANNEKVKDKVQAFAGDLHEVNENLTQGIDDLKQVEIALTNSRNALAETEASLAIARKEEEDAQRRALHDSTTGLPNRDLFDVRLTDAISLAKRHSWTLAVMFLDLDRFKSINDTHGHAAGDALLKEVAKRLLQHARNEDAVCRNGGDEFLYLLVNPKGGENIQRIAMGILNNIAQPIDIGDLQLVIHASIGIAVYPDNGATGEELIRNADTAMYRTKDRKSGYLFF